MEKIGGGEHPCHHCGVTVSWDKSYPAHADGLVVDHLHEDKTNNDPENLVPSCGACNILRGQHKMIATKRKRFGITWNGETLPSTEWASRLGISRTQLLRRLKIWPIDRVMNTPHCGTGPHRDHMQEHNGKSVPAKNSDQRDSNA